MTEKPTVSIIIINWNGKKHLLECLRSLTKVSFKKKEIIVIDNGSSDGSAEAVKRLFPGVKLVRNEEDLGFCAGNNRAVKYANGKYILFLNNDTTVRPDFLEPLVRRMESDSSCGIVQPKIVFQGDHRLQSGMAYLTRTGFLYYAGYLKDPALPLYNKPIQIYSANGACILVKKEVIETVGLFDEDYFAYFEETDFCHRALLAGFTIWYEPKSVMFHIGSVDNGRTAPATVQFNSFKNRICSHLKNLEVLSLVTILPINISLSVVFSLVSLGKGKLPQAVAVYRAIWWNIRHLPRTLHKRKFVQQLRKKSDTEIFKSAMKNPDFMYYLYLVKDLSKYRDSISLS